MAMNSTLTATNTTAGQTVVASYRYHTDAEQAVRRLAADGIPIETISIIGRNYETLEDVQGFYRPSDAMAQGAGQGAWFGGIFGFMLGAFGLFVFPGVGALIVLGPLAGMIAGAIGGAGVGALIRGLIAAGVPNDAAIKYQSRLQAGEFLLVVHGDAVETGRAHEILGRTNQTDLQTHGR